MELITRFFQDSADSYFLFGPRGTGKSTWLATHRPDALTIDLLDPQVHRRFLAHPERLEELVRARPAKQCIVIDEVQKVPAVLDVVHRLMVEEPKRQFILTGSSARKLKRAGTDLLAGRALFKTFHPFLAAELGTTFDLSEALLVGMLPVVLAASDRRGALAAYTSLYMQEEVRQEGLVRNIGNFARFLEALTSSHGSQLNLAQVARECEVGRKTVEGFVEILEDLLLSFRIPCFNKRARRRLVKHPKFYFIDPGVFRTLRPVGPLDVSTELAGACLEGLVAQHLRACIAYGRERRELYFWRSKSGVEVDFIVYGEDCFHAIEVKNATRVHKKDLRSLRSFLSDYPEARACLLYRGDERLNIAGIPCIPAEDFLLALEPGKNTPSFEPSPNHS